MTLEVSQSTMKSWRRCHMQYNYRFVQVIRRKRPTLQLIRGTMLGQCFDAFAENRLAKKKLTTQKLVSTTLAPYAKAYGKMFNEEKEYYGDILSEVERIALRYDQIYSGDGLTYLTSSETKKPYELRVEVDLAPGIIFTGSIDKMPKDKHGRVWDMDHKSHKVIPDAENRFSDLQQVFYMWAMPLCGYPKPTGVIWDYVRTKPPAIPEQLKNGELTKRKNIDTDYDTYMAEIVRLGLNPKDYKEVLDILKPRGTMDFFQRVQLPAPSPTLVKNVVEDAKATALEIQRIGGKSTVRSINRDCKSCEFYELCQAEFRGLDSSFIRKTQYEDNPDPRHIHETPEE